MRIALVTETYPPEVNGVALTLRHFATQLRELGHDVQLARPRQAHDTGAVEDVSLALVRGLPLPRYPGLRFGLPCRRALERRWHSARPDAVYVATEGPLGWSALEAARRLGLPVATGFHTRFDMFVAHYGAAFLRPAVLAWMRRFHNRAHATCVPTEELRSWLARMGIANAVCVARGVDTELFSPTRRDERVRAEWGVDDGALAVLHVGRIAPEKNLELALRSFEAIRNCVPSARMVWVGDGPSLAAMRRCFPQHVFCGVRHGEDLARHYASADLFLFPSLTDTFGNVTLEAMASGVSVVAYDTGAAREHLGDGPHCAAIAPGGADAFVATALRFALSPIRRRAYAQWGHERVAGLSHRAVALRLVELLSTLAQVRA